LGERVIWAFVIVLVLLIPILAIVIDSQVGQALANRISRSVPEGAADLASRLESLEADMRYLSESVESLSDETRFVRSLLEAPASESDPKGLPEPDDVPDRDN
jgi:predicted PurR-regulated permease PerM